MTDERLRAEASMILGQQAEVGQLKSDLAATRADADRLRDAADRLRSAAKRVMPAIGHEYAVAHARFSIALRDLEAALDAPPAPGRGHPPAPTPRSER